MDNTRLEGGGNKIDMRTGKKRLREEEVMVIPLLVIKARAGRMIESPLSPFQGDRKLILHDEYFCGRARVSPRRCCCSPVLILISLSCKTNKKRKKRRYLSLNTSYLIIT